MARKQQAGREWTEMSLYKPDKFPYLEGNEKFNEMVKDYINLV